MSRRREFYPVGTELESTHTLELPFHAQQELTADLRDTARILEGDPFITPSFQASRLGGIALESGTLSLSYSEATSYFIPMSVSNAEIRLTVDGAETQLKSTPDGSAWEAWDAPATEPYSIVSSSTVISKLDSYLKHPESISPMLDIPEPSAVDTARLLANYLAKHARRLEHTELYSSSRPMMQAINQGDSYEPFLSSINSELKIVKNRQGTQYEFITSAPLDIGGKLVEKQYRYSTSKKIGSVTLKSSSGISWDLLNRYAESDNRAADPLYTLQNNLNLFRDHLTHEENAA